MEQTNTSALTSEAYYHVALTKRTLVSGAINANAPHIPAVRISLLQMLCRHTICIHIIYMNIVLMYEYCMQGNISAPFQQNTTPSSSLANDWSPLTA